MSTIIKKVRDFFNGRGDLSYGAKILYLLLRDRSELSEKNLDRFSDERGVFIYYPLSEICKHMFCSEKTALKFLVELTNLGLIERVHTFRADKIYVKQNINYSVTKQESVQKADCTTSSKQTVQLPDNQIFNEQTSTYQISTKSSSSSSSSKQNTKCENSESDCKPNKRCKTKRTTASVKREEVKQQVDYERLIEEDKECKEMIDSMVDSLVKHYDPDIKYEHLKFILDNVKKRNNIKYITAYLEKCLKNVKADLAYKKVKDKYEQEREQEKLKQKNIAQEDDWEILKHLNVTSNMKTTPTVQSNMSYLC